MVDLNIFVSALLGGATARAVIAAISSGKVTPVLSPKLLGTISESAIEGLVGLLKAHAVLMTPRHNVQMSRDPDDDHLVNLALEVDAEAIVSGDGDITSLAPRLTIPVVGPRQLLTLLTQR